MKKLMKFFGRKSAWACLLFFIIFLPASLNADDNAIYDFQVLDEKLGSGLLMAEDDNNDILTQFLNDNAENFGPTSSSIAAVPGAAAPTNNGLVENEQLIVVPSTNQVAASQTKLEIIWQKKLKDYEDYVFGPGYDLFMPNSLILTPKSNAAPVTAKESAPKTLVAPGLEAHDLQLTGVIISSKAKASYGLLEDSAGQSYIVRPGTVLGKKAYRVVNVLEDRVILEETLQDFKGDLRHQQIEIFLARPGLDQ